MTLPAWLRLILHPITLWFIVQGSALYVFLHFTPLPRQALQRWAISIQNGAHSVGRWFSAPWRALRRVETLDTLVAHLQGRLAICTDTLRLVPLPVGAIGDFSGMRGYRFLPAQVIYQSFMLRENYALLDKGGKHGIFPGLGVISSQGVVGIIAETTATYSIMYSLFHKDVHLSASLPRHGVIGVTSWAVPVLNRLLLEYVPLYVQVELGEEVWTASNSLIFPAGLRIGRVKNIRSDFTRGFHAIDVDTYTDWGRLSGVFILVPVQ